ncbi:uncharacterized protein TNCV_190351 [Trichonephila clavipes]|nr:uncharacterized protein TNCV_190351 [Trichonephila clavipes]
MFFVSYAEARWQSHLRQVQHQKCMNLKWNEMMFGAPFLLTPINKSASEIKEITLDVRLPKQKNLRVMFPCEEGARLTSDNAVLYAATRNPHIGRKIGRKN